MDNGPGLSARPWPCPFTSGAQFKLDNASSGQFPSPTATTHLKGQSLLSGASAHWQFSRLHQVCRNILRPPCVCVCARGRVWNWEAENRDEESKGLLRDYFSLLSRVISEALKLQCKKWGIGSWDKMNNCGPQPKKYKLLINITKNATVPTEDSNLDLPRVVRVHQPELFLFI